MTASLVKFLRQPASYSEQPQQVDVRETHISYVFLTDTHAYKLKKPVKFDFLDFSTPSLRRQACEDELRLNRRLAPDVYENVLPITASKSGQLALGGEGEPVDWVVQMRRLSDNDALDAMIASETATTENVGRIAQRLIRFYESQAPRRLPTDEYRREVEGHVRANRQALLEAPHHFSSDVVKRVHTAQLRFLHCFPEVFDRRVSEGRIVEGHGDLRPDHIYLTPDPVVIDCIEFNAEFRQLDVLDELCFLAMECSHRSAPWIGRQIIDTYAETTGDRPPDELRAFYTAYRACVRAKVHLLRSDQVAASDRDKAINEASRYLKLADEIAHQFGPPVVLIVRGPSGVGKTTLAAALADLLAVEHLQTDALRQELFGQSAASAGHNEGRYTPENRHRVYQAMFERATKLVARGLSVVLDGAFLTNKLQRDAANVANRLGAQSLLVNCKCPGETAAARIAARQETGMALSDAQIATHLLQLQEQEPPPADLALCEVDTSFAISHVVRKVLDALKLLTLV